ncbi:MAG: hypothetical protein WD025_03760 [Bacteriovoracaceae bacterium]
MYGKIEVSAQESVLNFNSNFLKIFSMGQKRLISDTFWIKTLLDSDLEHYNKRDLNSWMYLRFNTISELDPLFKSNYVFGGKYLAIVKDDILGANKLLLRGLKHFPEEKDIIQMLAFNYTFELNDFHNGHYFYKKLSQFPNSPEFISSLLVKIQYADSLDLDEALASLKSLLNSESDLNSAMAAKLQKDIHNITIQLDLECLNLGGNNCSKKDPNGMGYKKRRGVYVAPGDYSPYKLHIKRTKP